MVLKGLCYAVCIMFCASLFAADPSGPQNYEPDLANSDIYLPHLKRIPLSGWWKLKKVSSDRKNNSADEGKKQNYNTSKS